MYKLNYRNLKIGKILFISFIVIGLFAIALTTIVFRGIIKGNRMDKKTEAYNIEINSYKDGDGNTLYKPKYYYNVNGKEYIYVLPYSTNIEINEIKKNKVIYYNSQDPSNCISDFESKVNSVFVLGFIIFSFLNSIFLFIGVFGIIKVNKKIKKIKWLEKNGTLIKNLEYIFVHSNVVVNNSRLMAIQIEYELSSGNIVTLKSNPRFDEKTHDSDGLVDLLIDLNNPDNYYIDFSIESTDYDIFNDKNIKNN